MKHLFVLSPFFVALLFFSYFILLLARHFSLPSLAFASVPSLTITHTKELPVTLTLPTLSRSFTVTPESLSDGKWQTSDEGVSYLLQSGVIGEKGNAVFYGHDLPNILGGLDAVQIGDQIRVSSSSGKEYVYQIVEKKVVDPSDVSVIQPTTDALLTLYTCTGWLDSQRLVLTAKLSQ